MKKLKTIFLFAVCSIQFAWINHAYAQCFPMIKIDGNSIVADENNVAGLKLPTWLKTGQTLEKGQYVFSISVIEFTVNGTALDYSQNISVTTVQTVPSGKVWKIESILKDPSIAIPFIPVTYSTAGTYSFTPSCNALYNIKVWGGGGGGGGGDNINNDGGGGGGGGGYTEGNYYLLASTAYTVTVGAGGAQGAVNANGTAGGTSSISIISISANGGAGGTHITGGAGAGGTASGGQINATGQNGKTGNTSSPYSGGQGGVAANNGGNGGAGGVSNNGAAGSSPGGGGGGAYYSYAGAAGAAGEVIISVSSSSGSGGGSFSGSRDRLQVTGIVNIHITNTNNCDYVVPLGKVFRLDGIICSSVNDVLTINKICGGGNSTMLGSIPAFRMSSGHDINTTTTPLSWPFPLYFNSGVSFSESPSYNGDIYICGVEMEIE